jgi:hypothetical protein
LTTCLPVLRLAGEHVRVDVARGLAIFFEDLQHLHELLRDTRTFCPSAMSGSSSSKSVSVLPLAVSLPTSDG